MHWSSWPLICSLPANFPPSGLSPGAKSHFCDAPQWQVHLFCQLEEEGENSWTAKWKRKCSSTFSLSSSIPCSLPSSLAVFLFLALAQLTGSTPGPAEWLWAQLPTRASPRHIDLPRPSSCASAGWGTAVWGQHCCRPWPGSHGREHEGRGC